MPELITIILEPKPDPLARQGYPEREPAYRLKLALKRLLREYGLRCVVIRNPSGDELEAFNDASEKPNE